MITIISCLLCHFIVNLLRRFLYSNEKRKQPVFFIFLTSFLQDSYIKLKPACVQTYHQTRLYFRRKYIISERVVLFSHPFCVLKPTKFKDTKFYITVIFALFHRANNVKRYTIHLFWREFNIKLYVLVIR